jgi:hypothetical protein
VAIYSSLFFYSVGFGAPLQGYSAQPGVQEGLPKSAAAP